MGEDETRGGMRETKVNGMLTILRLQVAVQDGHGSGRDLGIATGIALRQPQDVGADLGRIDAIMAAVESHDELTEDAPDKALLGPLSLELEVLDDATEVTVAAVFHVQMQVLADLEMLAVVVGHNVGMAQMREDLKLGMELLALLLGHAQVRDFLAAHDEAVGLAAHLSDDAKRAMACGRRQGQKPVTERSGKRCG